MPYVGRFADLLGWLPTVIPDPLSLMSDEYGYELYWHGIPHFLENVDTDIVGDKTKHKKNPPLRLAQL